MKVTELTDKQLIYEYVSLKKQEKEFYLRKKELTEEMERRFNLDFEIARK